MNLNHGPDMEVVDILKGKMHYSAILYGADFGCDVGFSSLYLKVASF